MSEPGDNLPEAKPKQTIILSALATAGEKEGDRIGHYKLLEKIGEGGMGAVWRAKQEAPVVREVALKVIKWGMDTRQVVARFEAERQALALMGHPNIAKLFDAGATEHGRPYFVMEYVRGIPITDYCDQEKLSTEDRLRLFTEVCHAVQHAHQKSIIHRDLKPSNILVTLSDGPATPKIIDFGIAKATGGQVLTDKTVFTALEQFIGTPAYMSPEQAEMKALDIDTRSDIYSLGVLLYELLTGKTPFDSKSLVSKALDEIRRIIREEEPPRPSKRLSTLGKDELTTTATRRRADPPGLVHSIRGDLDWIVMKALEKDRTRRYETADAFAEDIAKHIRHDAVMARPPNLVYLLRKMVRRHQLAFGAAAAILLLAPLGALALASIWPRKPPSLTQLLKTADDALNHYDRPGYVQNAIDALTAAKKLDDTNADVLARMGWAYWLWFEHSQDDHYFGPAFFYSSNALAANPKDALAHRTQGLLATIQGNWTTATNELLTAKSLTLDANGLDLISLALACLAADNWTAADQFAAAAERAVAHTTTPDSWQVFDKLGKFFQLTRNDDSGLKHFKEAAQMAPKDPVPHLDQAKALILKNDSKHAVEQFDLAWKRGDKALAEGGLGSLYLHEANYVEAAQHFTRAAEVDPKNYRFTFGLALSLRGQGKWDESTAAFQQTLDKVNDILAVSGNSMEARAHHAACLAGMRRTKEAVKELDEARKVIGNNVHLISILRISYQILHDDAITDEERTRFQNVIDELNAQLVALSHRKR